LDQTNHLAGAAIYGMDAPDLIKMLVIVIEQRLDATDLSRLIFAFPTATQGIIDGLTPLLMPEMAMDA